MGEVHIQSQQEPIVAIYPTPLLQKSPTTMDEYQSQEQDHSMVEPTDRFSMLRLNSFNNRQPPCAAAAANNNNSMKRRSPSSSSSGEPRSAKKLFFDQEDLTLHGFSAISLPVSLGTFADKTPSRPVLRRCSSDPHRPPADLPEQATPPPRGYGLPPLPPVFGRSSSDITRDSMRLKRMKERLREMRQWWDEAMKDEDEKEDEFAVAEDNKVQSQDELGRDSEEAVSVEWADKCVSLTFKCPCGKGYEVLLSENNCYYKLV
ncbi:uncharacterized protein LOC133318011 [Gastrolobium bilobum]|uniref:uncharacterized protein LOC133318011 n=1 Tax=Gastrolobium bilobum TaxID=150636 RepID=UPI002AB0907D|nr:uncharacterized protein LOC133318011 [Gastrolobium bilobum]